MFGDDLPHVRAWGRLKGTDVAPARIHPVVTDMASAVKVFADHNAVAAADRQLRFESGVPNGHHPFVHVQSIRNDRLLTRCVGGRHFDGGYGMRQSVRKLSSALLWAAPSK